MLTFDPNKQRELKFSASVEGIDPQSLEYNLRLSDGNIDYGVKGDYKNGQIVFQVPPLNEMVHNKYLYNLNEIKIEANDKNNKYYLNPFKDTMQIKKEMKMEAKIEDDKEEPFKVDASIIEDKETPVEREQEKKSKFREFLGE